MKMNDLISNRKTLAAFLATLFLLPVLLLTVPVSADPGTLYVDAAGSCGGNSPCYLHPQDAVNAANPGDTIRVYPGTYGERVYTSPKPPHWGPSDQYAPALIVFRDGLTIEAVDPDPSKTVIQTVYNWWVNKALPGGGGGSIEHSTGCLWNSAAKVWDGDCVRPNFGTAPNAIAVIASNVVIRGFTLHRPFDFTSGTYNTAGVMIGGLYAGDTAHLGSDNNVVENCVFSDVWHAVYIWHSSGNVIKNNIVAALATDHWAAISTYDGYSDAQITLGHPSENNLISHNTLANKGIALGAWAPPTWTSNAGSEVCCNHGTTWVGVTYAHGPVIVGCNDGNFWHTSTDNVLRILGVGYNGDTELWSSGVISVSLSAQLSYDGSADGSGVELVFTVDGTPYSATTVAGGSASTTADLPPGIYEVDTKVTVCPDCEFTDSDSLIIGQSVLIDIKPGSYPNSINLKSKGVVPVAVLSTGDFDASTVDPNTVKFADASPAKWSLEDVSGDGRLDLVLHFKTQDLSLTGATEATLTGFTYDDIPIEGTDTVNIVAN